MALGKPLDAWINPDMVTSGKTVPLMEMADALDKQYPQEVALGVKRVDENSQLVIGFWPGGTFRVEMVPRSGDLAGKTVGIFLDAYSAQILYEHTSDQREGLIGLVALPEPLHGGVILGAFGGALAFLAGLLPLMMLPLGWLAVRRLQAGLSSSAHKTR